MGLRESSIYNHFTGKEAIYAALIDTWGPADSVKRLRSPDFKALADNPATFCRRCAYDLLEQWLNPREQRFQELLRTERNRTVQTRQQYYDNLFRIEIGLYAEYFRGFAHLGLIKTTDAREAGRMFAAGLTFIRLEHFLMPDEPSPRRVAHETVDRFLEEFLSMISAR